MSKTLILIAFAGLSISACKKEVAFEVPQVEDFTGKYSVVGTVQTTGPATTSTAFSMSTGRDSASGSTCELITNYLSIEGYRLASSLLRENLRLRQFEPLFFGGGTTNLGDPVNQWTISELDTIFKVGKKLPFGKDFGQVEIRFVDILSTPLVRLYESTKADNYGNFVLIEKVEDASDNFKDTPSASPWAKIVTFSFSCRLRVADEPTYELIEMKNCRATMLFKPYVK